jgi:RND family efflux transporter MFP subunit
VNNATDPSIPFVGQSWTGYATNMSSADNEAAVPAQEQNLLAEWEAQAAAGVMDILLRVESSDTLAQGCAALVNDFQNLIGCRRVALGVCGKHPESFRLLAVSGMATIDRRSESARAIEAVLSEAVLRSELTVWPLADGVSRHATFAHQKLASQADAPVLISSPLRFSPDKTVAAWVILGTKELVDKPLIVGLIRASEPRVAACLELLRRSEYNRVRRWFQRLTEHKRKWLIRSISIIAVILFLALWIPWPYTINCNSRLQPTVRRFVAAPFEGILEKSLVEPGDLVKQDQVLARMDAREIRLQISETTADLKRAEVKRNVQMAKQDQGSAQMAALEKERLDLKLQLLESRSKKLDIKSPTRGIVLRGDQKRAEGMPVSIGQNLFEVAPLDKMLVEVAIPERDFTHTQAGQKVRVKLDAYPGQTIEGTLIRIHPRTEEWDNDYVFVGEMLIDNPKEIFRPGMNGKATIYGKRHTLYWNLFHKLWENAMMYVGW